MGTQRSVQRRFRPEESQGLTDWLASAAWALANEAHEVAVLGGVSGSFP